MGQPPPRSRERHQVPATKRVGGSNLSTARLQSSFRRLASISSSNRPYGICSRCWSSVSALGQLFWARFFSSFDLQTARIAPMRLKFSAMHTSLNTACTRCSPRRLNWRSPSTLLIHPVGGSASTGRCGLPQRAELPSAGPITDRVGGGHWRRGQALRQDRRREEPAHGRDGRQAKDRRRQGSVQKAQMAQP